MSQPLADTAIEITADTEPFDDDLDRLARRTRRRKVTQPVEADTRTMLAQIETALGSLRAEIEVDPGTARLVAELDAALDGFSGDVNLDPNIARLAADLDTALAGLEFEAPITPTVPPGPMRDARGRFIKAGTDLGNDAAKSFDRAFGPRVLKAVKDTGNGIAKIGGPIAASLLAATAGALAFASALTTISGLVAALGPAVIAGLAFLPGFLLARAVALGVFKLAVIGVGEALQAAAEGDAAAFEKALEKLSPAAREFAIAAREAIAALTPLQQAIQEAAFFKLADDVTAASRALLGTRDSAVEVAEQFNRIAAEALGFAGSTTAIDALRAALGGVRDFLAQITPAVRPLLDAFAGLAAQAGQFGDDIGAVVAELASKLASSLSEVDLAALFADALPTLQTLGQILGDVGDIARQVFAASGAEGAGLLGTIAELTTVVADFLETAGGFGALQSLMQGAADVGAALGDALGAVLPALAGAIGPIAQALGPVAQVLAAILAAVAPLLPPLGELVAVLGGALVEAVTPLVPVIASLARLLGTVFGALGPILTEVGTAIASILSPAAGQLTSLFEQLEPVIGDVVTSLGGLLAPLLRAIGPLIAQLVQAVIPMIPAFVALVPPLVDIVVALTPLIALAAQLLGVVVAIVAPIVRAGGALAAFMILNVVVPLVEWIARALTSLISPLADAGAKIGEFTGWLNGVDWAGVGAAISGAFSAAWSAVVAAVDGIVGFVMGLPGRIGTAIAAIPGLVVGLFRRMGSLALQAVGVALGLVLFNFLVLPQKIISAVMSIPGILRNLFTRAGAAARGAAVSAFNGIVAFIGGVPPRIGAVLGRLSGIISSAWSRAIAAGRRAAVDGFNGLVSYVGSIPGRIAGLAGRFVTAGSRLVGALVRGLRNVPSLGSIGSAIAGVIRSQANNIIGAINAGISRVDSLLPGSLPRIPTFARGDIVDKPTLGVFGEAGREVIIPLERPQRARALAEESGLDRILTGGAGGSPIYVSLRAFIGGREITDIVSFEVASQLDETAAQVDAGVRAF